MEKERILRSAKSAETIAAVCTPLVWISLLTVVFSAIPYLAIFLGTRGDVARTHAAGLLLEVFFRLGSIGALVGMIATPAMMFAAWRADLLARSAAAITPMPVRSAGTYGSDGTSKRMSSALKGGATTWIF